MCLCVNINVIKKYGFWTSMPVEELTEAGILLVYYISDK